MNKEKYVVMKESFPLNERMIIALGILVLDLIVFILPLTALFLMYIILVNPPWFREFLDKCK